jgi:pimeloyl-ACP methyl ester carboxylesterase
VAAFVDALPERAVLLGHSYGDDRTGGGPPDPEVVARLDALLAADEREELLVTFMREVPRVPEAHIELMRAQDSWPARIAAAQTIPRELRAVNDYDADSSAASPAVSSAVRARRASRCARPCPRPGCRRSR